MPPHRKAGTPTDAAIPVPSVGPNHVVTESPRCVEVPLPALDDWVTPTDRYFIRNHLPVPTITQEDWRLTLEGLFQHPLSINYRDLIRLPHRSVVVTTECAG